MARLRSFLYLDNYKMYSFSSQLFEGLTEYVVRSQTDKTEQSETSPSGSGKVLADIIEKDASSTEKKFLHDYSYNLFEDALISQGKVLELDRNSIAIKIEDIKNYSFVKITGRVVFNDLKQIGDTISNFNSLGEALGYLTMKNAYDKEVKAAKDQFKSITDRSQRAKVEALFKNKADFKKVLQEQNLQFDAEFLKHLSYILDYGYNQQFEVQIPISTDDEQNFMFSAQLDRGNLKDNEYRIIKKFSRETEREFVLFGILTQIQPASEKISLLEKTMSKVAIEENVNMKEALMNMVGLMTNIEKTFTGKLDYEYIIDPISLYLEI
ncbi:MAG: hypothetical protein ABI663_11010 [Chryseolinea sp.]